MPRPTPPAGQADGRACKGLALPGLLLLRAALSREKDVEEKPGHGLPWEWRCPVAVSASLPFACGPCGALGDPLLSLQLSLGLCRDPPLSLSEGRVGRRCLECTIRSFPRNSRRKGLGATPGSSQVEPSWGAGQPESR